MVVNWWQAALDDLVERGHVVPCEVIRANFDGERKLKGFRLAKFDVKIFNPDNPDCSTGNPG